jgi:hypothetical protein
VLGPGYYEQPPSSFERKGRNSNGAIISAPQHNMSSRVRAALVNPGLLKINGPSIPSKLLTPILDTLAIDRESQFIIQNEFCLMGKLIDDPNRLGPGSYNISGNLAKSPSNNALIWHQPTKD